MFLVAHMSPLSGTRKQCMLYKPVRLWMSCGFQRVVVWGSQAFALMWKHTKWDRCVWICVPLAIDELCPSGYGLVHKYSLTVTNSVYLVSKEMSGSKWHFVKYLFSKYLISKTSPGNTNIESLGTFLKYLRIIILANGNHLFKLKSPYVSMQTLSSPYLALTYAPWSFANRLIALLPIDENADNNLRVLHPDLNWRAD